MPYKGSRGLVSSSNDVAITTVVSNITTIRPEEEEGRQVARQGRDMGRGQRSQQWLLPWQLLVALCVQRGGGELSDFVSRFERVRMQAFSVPPTRSVDAMDVAADSQGGYRVSFMAYGQHFNLSLAEDPRHVNRIPVFVHNTSGVSKVAYEADYSLYIGRLEDNPRSEVMGYFRDGVFDGVIRTENNVYFVEPADNFFLEKQNYDAVVYSGMEVMTPDCVAMKGGARACFQNTTRAAIGPSKKLQRLSADADLLTRMSAQRMRSSTSGASSGLRVCGVELLADHTFFRSRSRNVNLVVQEMILHLHYADLVFRNTDFQLPFRVGLIPEKVTIFTEPSSKGYPLGQEDLLAKDYLASFSFYVQRHCLVVGFSHRPFESNTLGISFVANPDPEGPVGGICELPMRFIDQDTIHSFNIASITTSTSNRKRVPHGVSFGTVTHEIGHSFGSPHDPAADPACHPIGKSGFFIMVKYSVDGSLPNHRAFSPCSVRDMRKVLGAKGTCLAEDGARCGNGIIEPGEECDCGSEATCDTLDPCCSPAPSGSQLHEALVPPQTDLPCTVRRAGGSTCSPRSSACCSDQCGATLLRSVVQLVVPTFRRVHGVRRLRRQGRVPGADGARRRVSVPRNQEDLPTGQVPVHPVPGPGPAGLRVRGRRAVRERRVPHLLPQRLSRRLPARHRARPQVAGRPPLRPALGLLLPRPARTVRRVRHVHRVAHRYRTVAASRRRGRCRRPWRTSCRSFFCRRYWAGYNKKIVARLECFDPCVREAGFFRVGGAGTRRPEFGSALLRASVGSMRRPPASATVQCTSEEQGPPPLSFSIESILRRPGPSAV
ncbi:hypothetical protein HPB51_007239 [Rhipicephalus microplus]|uniref:Disintegrin and metalloproteinase domain-containing protein 10 n=1 Tax=Rhipicephalus microplus TaxID=6941 RepID=A0A9J6E0Q8_RHIMP|nr:hypothetical protein HPB51_007239 [Rhipicephalus microplus]